MLKSELHRVLSKCAKNLIVCIAHSRFSSYYSCGEGFDPRKALIEKYKDKDPLYVIDEVLHHLEWLEMAKQSMTPRDWRGSWHSTDHHCYSSWVNAYIKPIQSQIQAYRDYLEWEEEEPCAALITMEMWQAIEDEVKARSEFDQTLLKSFDLLLND